jgi:predicted NUDIX family NTP pyrophosphohydrolase
MSKQSAGLLLYTGDADTLQVVVVHPSGAYNKNAAYSLPKGEPGSTEALEDAARRETLEEIGVEVNAPLLSLGHVDYKKSRKRVFAWAAKLPEGTAPRCASWEIDRAELVSWTRARELLHEDQRVFVDRLLLALRP